MFVALALVVVAGAVWVFLRSDLLAVRNVEVSGVRRLTAAQVEQRSGIQPGTPLLRVGTSSAASRVRELPAVAAVTIRRDWPHTVRITVVERQPVSAVRDGSNLRLVDRTGVDFADADPASPGVPVLDVDLKTSSRAVVRAAIDVIDALPASVRSQVTHVAASSRDDVRLSLSSGAVVVWGGPERAGDKAAALAALISRPAKVYDVSVPDTPTTR